MSAITRFSTNSFPAELSENIFSHLPPSALAATRRVNKTWKSLTNEILLRVSFKNMGKSIIGDFFSDAKLGEASSFNEDGSLAALRTMFTFLKIIANTKEIPRHLETHDLSCEKILSVISQEVLPINLKLMTDQLYPNDASSKEELQEKAFNHLLTTKSLFLENLSMIPFSHKEIPNVSNFTVENSSIVEMPFLGKLLQLRSLTITNSPLQCLPSDLGKNQNITEIFINRTPLKSIPSSLLKPQIDFETSFLDLSCNDIRFLDETIKNHYNKISLEGNRNLTTPLEGHSDGFNHSRGMNLKFLEIFCLSQDDIRRAPFSIAKSHTSKISMTPVLLRTWNQLGLTLSEDILHSKATICEHASIVAASYQADFSQITTLDWSNLNLIALPNYFRYMPNLETLDLSGNLFLTTPEFNLNYSNHYPKLKTIILSDTLFMQDSEKFIFKTLKRNIPQLERVIFSLPQAGTLSAASTPISFSQFKERFEATTLVEWNKAKSLIPQAFAAHPSKRRKKEG